MEINQISVLGGFGRGGEREPVARLDLRMGDVVSVLGPTGSGKTALINDIALFADANTASRRRSAAAITSNRCTASCSRAIRAC